MKKWKEIYIRECRISLLRQKLKDTDYKAIKYAEGALSFAEYADTLKQRQEWRAEINAIEVEIKTLRGEENE